MKIEQYPQSSLKSNLYGGIFQCVVTRQTSFFYRVLDNEIEILTITDNRQNPDDVLKEIKETFLE